MKKINPILGVLAVTVTASVSFTPLDSFAEAGGGGAAGAGNGVPAVASRYVTRLQELVQKADEAALRGAQLMADGDYEGAIREFKAALDLLPDAPMTKDRREAYTQQFATASVKLARQRADEARYEEATELLQAVLAPDIDPDNLEAKRLLEQLQDPEYYSPALTPEHLEKVRRVELALKVGKGAYLIGDYDAAVESYYQVLNDDAYNEAARRSLEETEQRKIQYYGVARDHTRAKFLSDVAAGWELPVPITILPDVEIGDPTVDDDTSRIRDIEAKLQRIILPSVEFVDTPLRDALDFIQTRSVDLDVEESDVLKKGINIVIRGLGTGAGSAAPAAAPGGNGFDGGGGGGGAAAFAGNDDPRITLRLSNVPLIEALRYTTDLAQLKYKVEPQAVVVLPLTASTEDFFSRTFLVPPGFLASAGGTGGGGAAAPADPFAEPAVGGGAGVIERPSAKAILEGVGVVFPEGSSAIYNAGSSQLIVKNTLDQLELVEAYVDSTRTSGEKQIYITSRFVEISEEAGKELGFDWLLGPFNLPSSTRYFGSGGTVGNSGNTLASADYAFTEPGATLPIGSNPLTAGLRSGAQALADDSIDGLIRASAGDTQDQSVLAPAIFGIAGVFSDPQFQVMIRALNQRKGLDLLSAPSVMARSGQRAKMEVIREFIYPTEYDPPEIPNQVGTTSLSGVAGGSSSTFPVTPATPTAFETRNTGVTLEVDPVIGADGYTIDLNLAPEVVEFDGFINYGSPINSSGTNALGQPVTTTLTENRIEMPIFNTRKVTTQVTIWDKQTVALGGLIREDVQDIEDKVPFLGDLPAIGRLFRSSIELHLKKNLTIFVTAELVDPSGRPIHP